MKAKKTYRVSNITYSWMGEDYIVSLQDVQTLAYIKVRVVDISEYTIGSTINVVT